MSNITATFCDGSQYAYIDPPLFQHDNGVTLTVEGAELPAACTVYFSHTLLGGDTTAMLASEGEVSIPDALLDDGTGVYAWYYIVDAGGGGQTRYVVSIPVTPTADYEDGDPTPEQATLIEQAIIAINTAAEQAAQDAQTATDAADRAEDAADSAEDAADRAEDAATAAGASQEAAETSAANAAASENAAAQYAADAARDADRAEQAAADSGYMWFYIENGDLYMDKTSNVDVDFYLEDGDLYVTDEV